jgi:hypothetical protein
MGAGDYYRGGNSLKPWPDEVKIDPATGLLKTTHGVSVWNRPNGLEKFGGAHKVTGIPPELRIINRAGLSYALRRVRRRGE